MKNTTTKSSTETTGKGRTSIAFWIVAGAGAVVLVTLLIVTASRPAPIPLVTDSPILAEHAAPEISPEAEQRSRAKIQLQRLQDEGDEVLRILDTCDGLLKQWNAEVESELIGPRGRYVAADEEMLERFQAVYHQARPTGAQIAACRIRVSGLLEPISGALTSGKLYTPASDALSLFAPERAFAEQAREELRQGLAIIQTIFADSKQRGFSGDRTLKGALDDLETKHSRARSDQIAASLNEARKVNDQKIADAKKQQILAEGRLEEERIKKEIAQSEERRRIEEENKMREAAHSRLRSRAKDPSIQAKYAPFLARGKWKSSTNLPEALSLADIQKGHLLDNVENFASGGSGTYTRQSTIMRDWHKNDRPKWIYPTTSEEREEYARRLQEFRELAPVWIELGLLRP